MQFASSHGPGNKGEETHTITPIFFSIDDVTLQSPEFRVTRASYYIISLLSDTSWLMGFLRRSSGGRRVGRSDVRRSSILFLLNHAMLSGPAHIYVECSASCYVFFSDYFPKSQPVALGVTHRRRLACIVGHGMGCSINCFVKLRVEGNRLCHHIIRIKSTIMMRLISSKKYLSSEVTWMGVI